jgi:predicted ATP-dependent endonuclease of OLD family
MSHLIKFRINGLAGRKEPLEWEFNRHTNVFFGLNGCGKTSVLKILDSAMRGDASLLMRVPFTSAAVDIYSISYKRIFQRTITMLRSGEAIFEESSGGKLDEATLLLRSRHVTEKLKWKSSPRIKGATATSWAHQYLPTSRLILGRPDAVSADWANLIPSDRPPVSEEQVDLFFARSVERLWKDYTSELLARIGKAQEAGLASILRAVLAPKAASSKTHKAGLNSHQAYERMKKFVVRQGSPQLLPNEKRFKARYDENLTLRSVVLDINKVEKDIEEAGAPRRQVEEIVKGLFSGGKTATFTDQTIEIKSANGSSIGIASLSSGEKHLLMMLVETLLAGESTIIIDEPEISMHVDWQKCLVHTMRVLNPHAQIVIATHSPEIMADVDDALILRM